MIGSFTFASLIGSISGAFGAKVSTFSVAGSDGLPAGSVWIALITSSFLRLPGFGTVHLPSVPTVVVAVVPSG